MAIVTEIRESERTSMTTLTTTFTLLKLHGACGQKHGSGEGYDKLATSLGGVQKYGKNTPIPLSRILESNGLDDALWCLAATEQDFETVVRPVLRSYLADMLEHLALSLQNDTSAQNLLTEGTALLRKPNVSDAELIAYERKAWAARAAAWDARAAAGAAAGAAVDAAWAARAASGDAAWAAWAAAGAETQWQIERFRFCLEQELPA